MHRLIAEHRAALEELCRENRVRRLELFGSAASDDDVRPSGDLDFLVEFEDLQPRAYAEAYFGLLDSLTALFGRPVDLVSASAVKNPYFLRGIEAKRVVLYAA